MHRLGPQQFMDTVPQEPARTMKEARERLALKLNAGEEPTIATLTKKG